MPRKKRKTICITCREPAHPGKECDLEPDYENMTHDEIIDDLASHLFPMDEED